MPESRNTAGDLQRAAKLFESKQLLGKVESNHLEVVAMMRAHIQDGLGAMRYGQYGGSTPDPTGNTAERRDSVAETHLARYEALVDEAHKAFDELDRLRRLYMSANNDARNRKDPTAYCRLHWEAKREEGHPRVTGDLCKWCDEYRKERGRLPDFTDIEYLHTRLVWPPFRYDPKQRKAV